ncbi:MAG: DUF3048 domain-containing protein [Jatrophihabitantaceae bacterium]
MMCTTRAARIGLLSTTAVSLLATACTGSGSSTPSTTAATPSSTPPSTSSAPAKPAPKPAKKKPAVNPFIGIGPVPRTPVIAVKIDDTPPGRPQLGIDKADIVYIEAAEGGLTRLAAIFGTRKPYVGYVRSTRPSDPDLLLQYGRITEAYSGGAHDSLPRVRRSGITSWSNDAGAPFYSRVNRAKSSYINLVLNLTRVAKRVRTNRPRNIGWTFAALLKGITPKPGYAVHTVVGGAYNTGTAVTFLYDRKLRKYIRYIDGVKQFAADGRPIATRNVVVQSCTIHAHPRDTDVLGNPSQFTYTVGHGAVSVFRYGKRIDGYWVRKKLWQGTRLVTAKGKPIPLAPGNSWVVLIRKGIAVR